MASDPEDTNEPTTLDEYLALHGPDEVPVDERRGTDLPDSATTGATRALADPRPVHMRVVGAWAGSAMRADPKQWVGFAKAIRLNRIDLMINDHSADRTCKPFTSASLATIARVADLCRGAGIELHLTSWILPCEQFITRAADLLVPLLRDHGVASLVWDAEEPWTLHKGGMTAADAGALVGQLFPQQQLGLTGITYLSGAKLRPLADRAQFLIPQAYATTASSFTPAEIVYLARTKWHKQLGKEPTIMGLAGYRQGPQPAKPMQAAVAAVAECDIDTVCYWSLYNIRQNPAIARFVATLRP